jgi:hypothetical protein
VEKIGIDKELEFETQKFFKKVPKSVAALQIRAELVHGTPINADHAHLMLDKLFTLHAVWDYSLFISVLACKLTTVVYPLRRLV